MKNQPSDPDIEKMCASAMGQQFSDSETESAGFPQFDFADQPADNIFSLPAAMWLMSIVQDAYENYKNPKATSYPASVKKPLALAWHNKWDLVPDSYCGFLAEVNTDNSHVNNMVLGFRGTNSTSEWISDASYGQVPYTIGNEVQGDVENGFYEIYTKLASLKLASLRCQIRCGLKGMMTDPTGKNNRLYIAGHSLGAAVAGIAAADIAEQYPDLEIIAYTYASPRIGDQKYVDGVTSMVDSRPGRFLMHRVFNTADIVPTLPPIKISDYLYQHTTSFVTQSLAGSTKNLVTGFSFSINKGDLGSNHQMCTYLEGCSNGIAQCQSLTKKTHDKPESK